MQVFRLCSFLFLPLLLMIFSSWSYLFVFPFCDVLSVAFFFPVFSLSFHFFSLLVFSAALFFFSFLTFSLLLSLFLSLAGFFAVLFFRKLCTSEVSQLSSLCTCINGDVYGSLWSTVYTGLWVVPWTCFKPRLFFVVLKSIYIAQCWVSAFC